MIHRLSFTHHICFSILLVNSANAQNGIDSTFRWLFKNLSLHYGNVFLDTTYLKADISQLKKRYSTELAEELELIKTFKMELINVSLGSMHQLSTSFRTVNEFYDEKRKAKMYFSFEDSVVLARGDSLHALIATQISNKKSHDSLMKIQNKLLTSTFDEKFKDQASQSQPKPIDTEFSSVLTKEIIKLRPVKL